MSREVTAPTSPLAPDLEAAVLTVLREHPDGLSEFALFAALAKAGFSAFEREVFADNLRMFRSHFVLFHVLYSMRDRLALACEGHLTIEAMRIRLSPWGSDGRASEGTSEHGGSDQRALAEHDPLRDYYLDLAHLETTEGELRTMLDAFWERFAADDRQADALRVFDLDARASWTDVKERHRALVFEHHPDRGGDEKKLAQINTAMRVLETVRRPRTRSSD